MRTCPVNALESFRLLGLRYEYLVFGLIIFIAFRHTITPFGSLAAGGFVAYSLQKLTAHQPEGWIQHILLIYLCHPTVRKYVPALTDGIERVCYARGVMPPSGARCEYEV